ISLMRFSNTNNTTWSPWVPYATNYLWMLTAGADGFRSVYGQFMDPSSNVLSAAAQITLDTRPPPTAFVTDYFVNESTPSLLVNVFLSDSSHFRVSVDYATSDGTATGGLDYRSANGTLVFVPG